MSGRGATPAEGPTTGPAAGPATNPAAAPAAGLTAAPIAAPTAASPADLTAAPAAASPAAPAADPAAFPATPLAERLAARIRAAGPMTLAEFMAACLMDPAQGYYATRDPFGAGGDFITAPEISQMFGELIGLALAQSWLEQGAPSPFTLAEAGPGRGTLMADLLRATRTVPGFHAAARITLVETSPHLRRRQRQVLAGHAVAWVASVAELPGDRPLWFLANEFFDALPIRQFLRTAAGWRERMVGVSARGGLTFALAGEVPVAALARRLADTRPGDVVELCPAAAPIMAELARRIARHGGAALVIDYGGWRSLGDTLQALSGHAPADPLAAPGQADLTAHVDFEALRRAAQPLAASALTPQGAFLQALGIGLRTRALAAKLSGAALQSHLAAARRLTGPAEMGTLFKALALWPPGAPPVPGLPPEPEAATDGRAGHQPSDSPDGGPDRHSDGRFRGTSRGQSPPRSRDKSQGRSAGQPPQQSRGEPQGQSADQPPPRPQSGPQGQPPDQPPHQSGGEAPAQPAGQSPGRLRGASPDLSAGSSPGRPLDRSAGRSEAAPGAAAGSRAGAASRRGGSRA